MTPILPRAWLNPETAQVIDAENRADTSERMRARYCVPLYTLDVAALVALMELMEDDASKMLVPADIGRMNQHAAKLRTILSAHTKEPTK